MQNSSFNWSLGCNCEFVLFHSRFAVMVTCRNKTKWNVKCAFLVTQQVICWKQDKEHVLPWHELEHKMQEKLWKLLFPFNGKCFKLHFQKRACAKALCMQTTDSIRAQSMPAAAAANLAVIESTEHYGRCSSKPWECTSFKLPNRAIIRKMEDEQI